MTRLLTLLGSGMDPDTLGFASRISAAGSSIEYKSLWVVDQLTKGLKTDGLWDSMTEIWPCVGSNLTAARQKLKYPGNIESLDNYGMVLGDYSEAAGITSTGSPKYLDTRFIPANHLSSDTSVHMSVGVLTHNTTSQIEMGVADAAANNFTLLSRSGSNFIFDSFDTSITGGRISVPVGLNTANGFYVGTRVASNDSRLFRSGEQIGSITTAAKTRPALAVFLCARNGNGTAQVHCTRTINFYSIGSGLSPIQVARLTARVSSFNTALGRATG